MDKPAKESRRSHHPKDKEKKSHKHKEDHKPQNLETGNLCTLIVGAGAELGPRLTRVIDGAVSCAWTDLDVNTTADAVHPQVFIDKKPVAKPHVFLVPLDTPRVHLGEGGTGLANSVYGFIYSSVRSINPLTAVFEFSEYAVTLSELNRLNRLHGDAFPVQKISYYSNGLGTLHQLSFPLTSVLSTQLPSRPADTCQGT